VRQFDASDGALSHLRKASVRDAIELGASVNTLAQLGGESLQGGGAIVAIVRLKKHARLREYLGLTDEQVGRLHKLGVESQMASVQTRADMELRHIELSELLRADNPDHDAIMQKLDEANALRGKMEKQHVETLLSARSVLTPEQLKKVKAFMENRGAGGGPERGRMMERHEGMRGPSGHGGPGGNPGGPSSQPKPTPPPAQ